MIKVKQILISLAVFWMVSYAAMFLLNGIIFSPSPSSAGDQSTQPMFDRANAVVMVSGSTNFHASAPAIGQNTEVDIFTRPILPASLVTIFAAFALACGFQLVQLGCRGNSPLLK